MKKQRPKRDKARSGSDALPALPFRSAELGRHFRCIAVIFILAVGTLPATAQAPDSNEYRLKLAFLYNFAQFVEWPADSFRNSGAPLLICVAGENPFQGQIEEGLRGRVVRGHPLEVRRLNPGDDPRACQIIFVRAAERKETPRILASSKGSNILTVGEAAGFAQRGGMINLTREENRLRFEVNISAAAQSGLKISSKLLALAKIVTE